MRIENQETVEAIISNPKVQGIVGTGTTAMAIDHNLMQILPEYITVVGGALGIILTSMMIVHKYIQIRNDIKNT